MAIVWLWFDQVLQIWEVGGNHMAVAQDHCTTTSYTEKQLEYKSSYTEKQMEYNCSYAEKLAV